MLMLFDQICRTVAVLGGVGGSSIMLSKFGQLTIIPGTFREAWVSFRKISRKTVRPGCGKPEGYPFHVKDACFRVKLI